MSTARWSTPTTTMPSPGIAPSDRAVLVGDSTWDCEAAGRAGVPAIGILTGGFSEQELRDAGAIAVFDSLLALVRRLEETPLA
jgi:phosphoglycolate phosphatase-like HAD superfamily hydrolase